MEQHLLQIYLLCIHDHKELLCPPVIALLNEVGAARASGGVKGPGKGGAAAAAAAVAAAV